MQALSIHVEPVSLVTLDRATLLSTTFKLLTNDALTIAVMEHLGLKDIATNDRNLAKLDWYHRLDAELGDILIRSDPFASPLSRLQVRTRRT